MKSKWIWTLLVAAVGLAAYAGNVLATTAVSISIATVLPYVSASQDVTRKRKRSTPRVNSNAADTPTNVPVAVIRTASRITALQMSPPRAPSASRTPNSRVRWETE